MSVKAKCPYCGKEFIRKEDELGKVYIKNEIDGLGKNRYFHIECHNKAKISPKKEWPSWIERLKNEENELIFYTDLCYDFLRKDLKIEANYIKIRTQLQNFSKTNSMKYEGMFKTLTYCYQVKRIDKSKAEGGIGIIPYFYEDAYNYFAARSEKANNLNSLIEEQINARKNAIIIKKKATKTKTKKNKYDLSLADEME